MNNNSTSNRTESVGDNSLAPLNASLVTVGADGRSGTSVGLVVADNVVDVDVDIDILLVVGMTLSSVL